MPHGRDLVVSKGQVIGDIVGAQCVVVGKEFRRRERLLKNSFQ